jgi:hypothetical protein
MSNLSLLSELGKPELSGERVIVRVSLLSENKLAMLTALYGTTSFEEYEVEINRACVPPDCINPHEDPVNSPDIADREFEALAFRLDPWDRPPSLKPGGANAWDMRDEFFALEDDFHATRRFLNRWGLWDFQLLHEKESLRSLPINLAFPYHLWTIRDTYIKAATGSPRAWLSTATPLSLKEAPTVPYHIVERSYCEDAIKATITIDHLSNVKFGICKRHDCRKFFKRTTAQKRLYCSPKCAHLANVRKLRNEKKKAESKGRKHATRKS